MIGQYAKKGAGVLVSGRLDQRSWEDKNTGQKRSRVEIVVEDFNFTGPANNDRNGGGYNGGNFGGGSAAKDEAPAPEEEPAQNGDEEIDLSEIPF